MTFSRRLDSFATVTLRGFSLTISLATTGCPANQSMDASMEFDIPSVPFDRVLPPNDGNRDDGGAMNMGDGGDVRVQGFDVPAPDAPDPTTLDVAQIDVNIPMQPCAFVVPPVAFGATGRGARTVYMHTDATGFAVGTHVIRDNAENVWIQRISREGAPTASGNISGLPMGRTARGGSVVRESMFLLTPWSQNEGPNELIYFKRTLDNFFEFPMSTQRVTATGVHREPQIASTSRGQILSFKSLSGMRTQLSAVGIRMGIVGTPTVITDADEDVSSFRLVSTSIGAVSAVVYRDNTIATPRVRYRLLAENGTPIGVPFDVATGADIGPVVDAAIDDFGNVWAVWVQANGLRLRRMTTPNDAMVGADGGLAEGNDGGMVVHGSPINVANSSNASDPGLSMDGTDLVVAYRDLSSMPGTIILTRVRADGTLRDRSVLAGCVSGGRLAVSKQLDSYGVGWVDDLETGAVARVGSARCR